MSRDRRDERGSALMLVPAGVLILVMLAVLSVDFAVAFGGQRELFDMASAAANDAAVVALDEDRYYRCGDVRLGHSVALDAVAQSLLRRDQQADAIQVTRIQADITTSDGTDPEQQVVVSLEGRVQPVFAGGAAREVQAEAVSAAREIAPVAPTPAPGGGPPAPIPPGGGPAPGGPPGVDPPGPGGVPDVGPPIGTLQLPPQTTTPPVQPPPTFVPVPPEPVDPGLPSPSCSTP